MKVYDVPYCAVVCYEYNGGERIVFKQESLSTKVAYLTGEKSPHVRSEYTMFKDGNQCHRWLSIKESIFDDIAINGYVGFYGKELGYDWIHIPKAYQSGLYFVIRSVLYGRVKGGWCLRISTIKNQC